MPFSFSSQKFSLDWIYNILEHKKEVERIVYEDSDPNTGFLLVPDFKWDGKQIGKESMLLKFQFHVKSD